MAPDNPEIVRGACSFCGETVTGRHAIIHYETATGNPGVWAECPGCDEIVNPTMLSKQFIQQIVSLKRSSTTHHECRHCGYSVEQDVDECPQCGSHELATYNLALPKQIVGRVELTL